MEKLIELLNEYEGQDTWSYDEEMGMPYYGWGDDCDYEAYLISKKYGFIKWLVENEKIGDNKNSDRYTMMKLMRAEINEGTEVFEGTERYEFVIMLLAIQDEPIKFLISILKNVEKSD